MKHINHDDYCCDNTWLKNCNNKTFTYSQLLGAMKFGGLTGVKLSTMPKHINRKMRKYLVQEGYIKTGILNE